MMTYDEAIERLMNSCADYESAIKILKEENTFLTDTIIKYNLDEISKERKTLLDNMNQTKKEAALALKDASLIKSRCLEKLKEIDDQIKEIQEELSDYKIPANSTTNSYIQENNLLKSQNLSYRDENKKLKILVCIIICIFIIYVYCRENF